MDGETAKPERGEHPHPKYSLATLQEAFAEIGIDARFEPFRMYEEPYVKGEGPSAEWVDPITGVTCRVWAEYEPWEDDRRAPPNVDDPARFERWREHGSGWYWDLDAHDGEIYGHRGDLRAAIRETVFAAWNHNQWTLEGVEGGISRTLFTWLLESSSPEARDNALSLAPYVRTEPSEGSDA